MGKKKVSVTTREPFIQNQEVHRLMQVFNQRNVGLYKCQQEKVKLGHMSFNSAPHHTDDTIINPLYVNRTVCKVHLMGFGHLHFVPNHFGLHSVWKIQSKVDKEERESNWSIQKASRCLQHIWTWKVLGLWKYWCEEESFLTQWSLTNPAWVFLI